MISGFFKYQQLRLKSNHSTREALNVGSLTFTKLLQIFASFSLRRLKLRRLSYVISLAICGTLTTTSGCQLVFFFFLPQDELQSLVIHGAVCRPCSQLNI